MHIVDDSKIRNLGEEIRYRGALSKVDLKFSDYDIRNLILAVKKEDGRVDTHSSGHLPEPCYRFLDTQNKYFADAMEKNNSTSIIFGYNLESTNRATFKALYDLTNKNILSSFYHVPLLGMIKMNDKILSLGDDFKLYFVISDYENLPLLALLKYLSKSFIKPDGKFNGDEYGIKLVLAMLSLQYTTKFPTINTSLKEILNPSAEFEFPSTYLDDFVGKFYEKLELIINDAEDDDERKVIGGSQLLLPDTQKFEEPTLSEFVQMLGGRAGYLAELEKKGKFHILINYPELADDYFDCVLSRNSFLLFYTHKMSLISGGNYHRSTEALKKFIRWDRIRIIYKPLPELEEDDDIYNIQGG